MPSYKGISNYLISKKPDLPAFVAWQQSIAWGKSGFLFGAKMIHLYKLLDPETDKVYYIGQTDDLQQRFYQHCQGKINGNPFLAEWILRLRDKGLQPKMVAIEKMTNRLAASQREQQLIEMYWNEGCPLLNIKMNGNKKIYQLQNHLNS